MRNPTREGGERGGQRARATSKAREASSVRGRILPKRVKGYLVCFLLYPNSIIPEYFARHGIHRNNSDVRVRVHERARLRV